MSGSQNWLDSSEQVCQVSQKHPYIDVLGFKEEDPKYRDEVKQKYNEPKTFENIFSFGDVCIIPAIENKDLFSQFQYSEEVAHNIL